MKIRKLLALALTGVTLLSTVPVHAQTTNSIGYTNFMPLDDGGNTYMMNSDHLKIGSTFEWNDVTETVSFNKILDQEIKLPKNMWVSFDVINTTFEETQERDYYADEDYFMECISNNYDIYLKDELEVNELPTDCTVTFKQDGEIIKQFTLDVDKRLDHVSFKFYNKSDSPVIVSTTTDNWFVGDVGYTAHKASKDITNKDWSFSFKKKKSFIATTDVGKGGSKDLIIGAATPDGKNVKVSVTKNGKLIAKCTVKAGLPKRLTMPKQGKYKVTIESNSEFFNIIICSQKYVNTSKQKSKLIIPLDYTNKELYEDNRSPYSSITSNFRNMLFASSGNGSYIFRDDNDYFNEYLNNFNDFTRSFYKYVYISTNNRYVDPKSKGNGWIYAVQVKNRHLLYDRLSW